MLAVIDSNSVSMWCRRNFFSHVVFALSLFCTAVDQLITLHRYAAVNVYSVISSSQGKTVKRTTQYHFVTWPDKGVPSCGSSLVSFVKMVKHNYQFRGSASPMIVHCRCLLYSFLNVSLVKADLNGELVRFVSLYILITAHSL